jgi:hypothetical protein
VVDSSRGANESQAIGTADRNPLREVRCRDGSYRRLEGDAPQRIERAERARFTSAMPDRTVREEGIEFQADRLENRRDAAAGKAMDQDAAVVEFTHGQTRPAVIMRRTATDPALCAGRPDGIESGE